MPNPVMDSKRTVVIVSDSTGETASRAARVALEQFFGIQAIQQRFIEVCSESEIKEAFAFATHKKAFVVFTLVDKKLCEFATLHAEETNTPVFDLLRDLLGKMSIWLDQVPGHAPGHRVNEEYLARISSATRFTSRHDDGQRVENLDKADVVILGVSRSSKSPVCQWLSMGGLRAANVPMILEIPPPEKIFEIDPRRVFVLKMAPSRLRLLRISRLREMGDETNPSYADPKYIASELEMVERLLNRNPSWTAIEVTMRAIEEIAAVILSQYQRRFVNGNAH